MIQYSTELVLLERLQVYCRDNGTSSILPLVQDAQPHPKHIEIHVFFSLAGHKRKPTLLLILLLFPSTAQQTNYDNVQQTNGS